ncbi:class I SAM-dependent methyltransferase [Actinomycetaceae bacterium L2_0104]
MSSVLRTVIGRGWVAPLGIMARWLPGYLRVDFLSAGLQSGILEYLNGRPASAKQVAGHFGYDLEMIEGLVAWLDLGALLGELRRKRGRYSVRSRRVKTLLKQENDPIAAFFEEFTDLNHRLVLETPSRLAQGEWFELSDADSAMVARTSRAGEPWLASAIEKAVPAEGNFRLVEVGCGSGAHIRTAAGINPNLRALGIELQEPAAAQARENVETWGLADRVTIEVGDVRERAGDGTADLVTLHQNIYYFPVAEQADLLRHLGTYVAPGGKLLITTVVRGSGPGSAALDLWGAMTRGASRLPTPDELEDRLRAAGYEDVSAQKLGPDGMYYAATGTWRG